MRILLAAVLSAMGALQGCASNTSSDPAPVVVNESDAASLRAATDLEGTLAVGSAITLSYERKAEYTSIPYLAVDIIHAAPDATKEGSPMQSVSVKGKFPGTPRILVVDENFAIVAQSTTATLQDDGTSLATVSSPRSGTRTILVTDKLWSLPMSFEVKVGE